jgi:hypothetical protein
VEWQINVEVELCPRVSVAVTVTTLPSRSVAVIVTGACVIYWVLTEVIVTGTVETKVTDCVTGTDWTIVVGTGKLEINVVGVPDTDVTNVETDVTTKVTVLKLTETLTLTLVVVAILVSIVVWRTVKNTVVGRVGPVPILVPIPIVIRSVCIRNRNSVSR